jgi:hypothetical protein
MTQPNRERLRRLWPVLAAVGWLVAVSAGMFVVFQYAGRAAPPAAATPTWPADVTLARTPGKPTVVMLAHPQCPCTRASMNEFAQIVTRASDAATYHVLFVKPPGVDDAWVHSDTYKRASAIPGVIVTADVGGKIAARLGAKTSGHVLVYDENGVLEFSGGITGARGHEGDNLGRQEVIAAVTRHAEGGMATTKTYGCGLAEEPRIQ